MRSGLAFSPEAGPVTLLVPSGSQRGRMYPLRRLPDGTLECRCRGYGYRSVCSHQGRIRGWLKPGEVPADLLDIPFLSPVNLSHDNTGA